MLQRIQSSQTKKSYPNVPVFFDSCPSPAAVILKLSDARTGCNSMSLKNCAQRSNETTTTSTNKKMNRFQKRSTHCTLARSQSSHLSKQLLHMAWYQKDRTYNINLKINMGFFDAIGATAQRAKLNGEIALVDREITTRKKEFGVELYDIISKQQKQRMKNDGSISSMLETPGMFHTIENEIKEPLDKYSKEIRVMELEKRNIENQIELHEAKKIRDAGSTSSGDIGKRMSDTAKETELFLKIKYLDREMLLRKEQFGLTVWDAATGQDWFHEALINETKDKSGLKAITGTVGGLVKGVKGTLGKTLGAVSAEEREIAACVNKAKEDVKPLEEKKREKEKALAAIFGKS